MTMLDDRPERMVHRVCAVPDRFRVFSVPGPEVMRQFGLDDELLASLLDLGLPHRGAGPDRRLDPLDLENIGSGLGLMSPQEIIRRRWARSLRAVRQESSGAYQLRISWSCPWPGHPGPCRFTAGPRLSVLVPGVDDGSLGGTVLTGLSEPLRCAHDFGPGFAPVVAAARRLVFHRLPPELVTDLGFLAETGMADCQLGNRHLMLVAREHGFDVRSAAGFFIGAPFPARHVWFEVRSCDQWIPADPFFLDTLARWGVLSAEDWPLDHSPRNVLIRLEATDSIGAPLVLHGDQPAPVTVVARWTPTA
jgi:hypothetical protein